MPFAVTKNDTTKEDASNGGCGQPLVTVGGVGVERALRANAVV